MRNLSRLTVTNLCGDAGAAAASDGLAGDVASEHGVDWIEETGLSSSYWTNEQDSYRGHWGAHGPVEPNTFYHLCPLPVETSKWL